MEQARREGPEKPEKTSQQVAVAPKSVSEGGESSTDSLPWGHKDVSSIKLKNHSI